MKKRYLIALLVALIAVPALAVFNEKNISRTLSVLRFELKQAMTKDDSPLNSVTHNHDEQHKSMVSMIQKCNELSLILYSQNQDFTFDMTYALEEVTSQYEAFSKEKMPYDDIIARLDIEIDRYQRLIESLRRLPPALEEMDEVPDSLRIPRDSLMTRRDSLRASRDSLHGMPGMMPGDSLHRMPGMPGDSLHGMDAGGPDGMPGAPEGQRPQGAPGQEGNGGALADAISIITGIENGPEGHVDEEDEHRPFFLGPREQEDRDSCLVYAKAILANFQAMREHVEEDNEHYQDMSDRLKEAYDYAQQRYRLLQKKIFVQGQDNYLKVIKAFPSYVKKAYSDAMKKYGQSDVRDEHGHMIRSSWRGPVVVGFLFFVIIYLAFSFVLSKIVVRILSKKVKRLNTEEFQSKKTCFNLIVGVIIFLLSVMLARSVMNQNFFVVASRLLLVYAWLLLATLSSLFIRSSADKIKAGVQIYTPVLVLGLVVITFRIIFIPNSVVNLIYPILLVLFSIWQIRVIRRNRDKVLKADLIYAYITLLLMIATTVITCCGYVLLGVQLFIWWLFQLTAIATVTAFYDLLRMYENAYLKTSLKNYRESHTLRVGQPVKGSYIVVTWLFDLIEMAAVPVFAVLSVPLCIWLASDVFDLNEICRTIFFHPFFNLSDASGNAVLHLSLFKLVLVVCLFFIFKYAQYLIKSVYRHYKLEKVVKESGQDFIHANQVNITLANNLVSIITWGLYIIITIILLKIPMGALSVVAAGLATGIGLALKDVLNNFIYGIQLMSGRLRVGDWIECDGVRGKVDRISYQSTQIETLEGAVMAFTNSTLFNKNFKNLTRNNSYELVTIPVGVQYGADVAKVRELLQESLKALSRRDKYGREVLDASRNIVVAFSNFGDNSVDLVVKMYILVEEGPVVIAKAKEIIYNTLNENNIEIPFPQRDIYIRQMPEKQ